MSEPTIKDFLPNAVESGVQTEEIQFKRFKKPFKIKSLMASQMDNLRKQATNKKYNEKTHIYDEVVDQDKLTRSYVTESIVVPNLNSEELQTAYGTFGSAYETLTHMLTASEFNALVQKVNDLSGLNEDNNAVVKTVKN